MMQIHLAILLLSSQIRRATQNTVFIKHVKIKSDSMPTQVFHINRHQAEYSIHIEENQVLNIHM